MALGGADRPGEVFLSFLVRYGKIKKGLCLRAIDPKARTQLSRNSIFESEGQHSADMSAVFLMDHCITVFQRCWTKLSKKLNYISNNVSKTEQSNHDSLLVDLFDVETLRAERSACVKRAATFLSRFSKTAKKQEHESDDKTVADVKTPTSSSERNKKKRKKSGDSKSNNKKAKKARNKGEGEK